MPDDDPGIFPENAHHAPLKETKHIRRTRKRLDARRRAFNNLRDTKGFTKPGSQNRKK